MLGFSYRWMASTLPRECICPDNSTDMMSALFDLLMNGLCRFKSHSSLVSTKTTAVLPQNKQMDTTPQTRPPKSRRTPNACIACRQSKIKCSGNEPCQNCQRRDVPCAFTEKSDKVVVSGRYLEDLQRRAGQRERSLSAANSESQSDLCHSSPGSASVSRNRISPSSQRFTRTDFPLQHGGPIDATLRPHCNPVSRVNAHIGLVSPVRTLEGQDSQHHGTSLGSEAPVNLQTEPLIISVWTNPFSVPCRTIKSTGKDNRNWLWLASWSPWSFTIRLMLTLSEKLRSGSLSIPEEFVEPEIYSLEYQVASVAGMPDISGLPSLNHAIYLFATVKFHLGQTYRLFDEAEFENEIHEFYSNALQNAMDRRLWFVKFLLILAFGTAFHAPPTSSQEPPGAKFFQRAMALMPDPGRMWKESLLGIEVLALAGLYLFAIDERESAHIYLGNAIRMAQMEGLHTLLPEEEVGIETATSSRDLWWTLYIMDRHFSTSVGLPMSVHDSDITTPVHPPKLGSQGDTARSLQVNLSHLLSVILTTIYKPTKTPLETFLEQTRSILNTLAHHAQNIEKIICLKFDNCLGTMPKDTRYLTMLYHECVIVATRPLLLSVLKERLDTLGHPGDENWESFLEQTATVISTGIKSAAKTLQILSSEYSLLEVFLPYDVHFAFGAALHLTMASALFPHVVDYQQYRHLGDQVFNDLIGRGNRIAKARRAELSYLEDLCGELAAQIEQQGHQALALSQLEIPGEESWKKTNEGQEIPFVAGNGMIPGPSPGHPSHDLYPPPMPSNMEFLDDLGISSEDFLSIVQQMGDPGKLPDNMLTLDL